MIKYSRLILALVLFAFVSSIGQASSTDLKQALESVKDGVKDAASAAASKAKAEAEKAAALAKEAEAKVKKEADAKARHLAEQKAKAEAKIKEEAEKAARIAKEAKEKAEAKAKAEAAAKAEAERIASLPKYEVEIVNEIDVPLSASVPYMFMAEARAPSNSDISVAAGFSFKRGDMISVSGDSSIVVTVDNDLSFKLSKLRPNVTLKKHMIEATYEETGNHITVRVSKYKSWFSYAKMWDFITGLWGTSGNKDEL